MVIMGWGGRCGAEEGEGGNKSEKVRLWGLLQIPESKRSRLSFYRRPQHNHRT